MRTFAARGSALDIPAVPISAVINALRTQVVVTFDRPLVPDPAIDHTNWTVTFNVQDWIPTAGAVVGSTVVLDGALGGGHVADSLVHYQPPPFDVITLAGELPVEGFFDLPLTA